MYCVIINGCFCSALNQRYWTDEIWWRYWTDSPCSRPYWWSLSMHFARQCWRPPYVNGALFLLFDSRFGPVACFGQWVITYIRKERLEKHLCSWVCALVVRPLRDQGHVKTSPLILRGEWENCGAKLPSWTVLAKSILKWSPWLT